jgi:hypothetical protein
MIDPADWFPITIKFRGKCIECGKDVISGEQALWSKSTKAIKHLDCSITCSEQVTRNKQRFLQTTLPKCFICGNEKTRVDEYDSDDYDDYGGERSQSYICTSCLRREDAFQAYQNAFLQKIKRYLK